MKNAKEKIFYQTPYPISKLLMKFRGSFSGWDHWVSDARGEAGRIFVLFSLWCLLETCVFQSEHMAPLPQQCAAAFKTKWQLGPSWLMLGGLGGLGAQMGPLMLSATSGWLGWGGHGLAWLLHSGLGHLSFNGQSASWHQALPAGCPVASSRDLESLDKATIPVGENEYWGLLMTGPLYLQETEGTET